MSVSILCTSHHVFFTLYTAFLDRYNTELGRHTLVIMYSCFIIVLLCTSISILFLSLPRLQVEPTHFGAQQKDFEGHSCRIAQVTMGPEALP